MATKLSDFFNGAFNLDGVQDVLAEMYYLGMDPQVTLETLFRYAKVANRAGSFGVDLVLLATYGGVFGMDAKKIATAKTSQGLKDKFGAQIQTYHVVQGSANQAPDVITFARICAVVPFVITAAIQAGLIRPLGVMTGLPQEFAFPQGAGIMTDAEWAQNSERFKAWTISFARVINAKKWAALPTAKTDEQIWAEQVSFVTAARTSTFSQTNRATWRAQVANLRREFLKMRVKANKITQGEADVLEKGAAF
jgi:hypothetical protein